MLMDVRPKIAFNISLELYGDCCLNLTSLRDSVKESVVLKETYKKEVHLCHYINYRLAFYCLFNCL